MLKNSVRNWIRDRSLNAEILIGRKVPVVDSRPDHRMTAAGSESERSVHRIGRSILAKCRRVEPHGDLFAARPAGRQAVGIADCIRPSLTDVDVRAVEGLRDGEGTSRLEVS